MLTLKQINEKILNAGVKFTQVTLKNNIITVRKSFFYTNGGSYERQVEKVKIVFPNASIIDSGEVWKAFKGGASIANQSHWFVKFTISDEVALVKSSETLDITTIKQ